MNSSDVDGEFERLRIRMLEHPSVVDAEIRSTFPHHFHEGSDENVKPSEFTSLEELVDRVMTFVEEKIRGFRRNY